MVAGGRIEKRKEILLKFFYRYLCPFFQDEELKDISKQIQVLRQQLEIDPEVESQLAKKVRFFQPLVRWVLCLGVYDFCEKRTSSISISRYIH